MAGPQPGTQAGTPGGPGTSDMERSNSELSAAVAELKRKNSKLTAKLKLAAEGAGTLGVLGVQADARGGLNALSRDAIAHEELQERVTRLEADCTRLTAENAALQRKVLPGAPRADKGSTGLTICLYMAADIF